MNWDVYYICQKVARQEGTITYEELGRQIGMDMNDPRDRDAISGILGEISTYEHSNGRPLLSAVVVRKEKKGKAKEQKTPGGGFFGMAKEVGRLEPDGDTEAFYVAELIKVYSFWKRH